MGSHPRPALSQIFDRVEVDAQGLSLLADVSLLEDVQNFVVVYATNSGLMYIGEETIRFTIGSNDYPKPATTLGGGQKLLVAAQFKELVRARVGLPVDQSTPDRWMIHEVPPPPPLIPRPPPPSPPSSEVHCLQHRCLSLSHILTAS